MILKKIHTLVVAEDAAEGAGDPALGGVGLAAVAVVVPAAVAVALAPVWDAGTAEPSGALTDTLGISLLDDEARTAPMPLLRAPGGMYAFAPRMTAPYLMYNEHCHERQKCRSSCSPVFLVHAALTNKVSFSLFSDMRVVRSRLERESEP